MDHPRMGKHRVLIIGLDGFDRELADHLADKGELPNLKRMFEQGISGDVQNPEKFEPGASWPSFYYGLRLGSHGQFDGMQLLDGTTYRKRQLDYEDLVADAFWKAASSTGKRVAIVDAPSALLEPEINGVQVTDWLCHVYRTPKIRTVPQSLGVKIVQQYGDNPFDRRGGCPTNWVNLSGAEHIADFRNQLIERIKSKTAFSRDLLRQEPWDLFLTVFHDPHDVGHMCWHMHDIRHESHNPEIVELVGDPVRDVYIELDTAIGQLLEAVPEEFSVLLYSNVGMGREMSATGFLDEILKRLEASYFGAAPAQSDSECRGHQAKSNSLYAALVPERMRERMRRTRIMERYYDEHHSKKRRSRHFFELAADHAVGGVRINLVGRERYGIVENGNEYRVLCDRLIADLAAVENVETGERLVDSILRTSELHTGPMRQNLPDVIMKWNRSGPIRQVYSEKIGTLRNRNHRTRSGDHISVNGFFIAMIRDREFRRLDRTVDVTDFAPTLCELLGVPFPTAEGSVISELVDK